MNAPTAAELTAVARRIAALALNLRRMSGYLEVEADEWAAMNTAIEASELHVAAMIEDVHERVICRWTQIEGKKNTEPPDSVVIQRYDIRGRKTVERSSGLTAGN